MTTTAEPTSTRLMNALNEAARAGLLEFIGGSAYTVRLSATSPCEVVVVRSGSTEEMWSWTHGFERGRKLAGPGGWWHAASPAESAERLERAQGQAAEFRRLLVDTPMVDQVRIHVLACLEEQGMTFEQLGKMIDRDPQSVRNALLLGRGQPMRRHGRGDVLDAMVSALGRPLLIRGSDVGLDTVTALSGKWFEPAGIARMRALLIAVERRLVDGVEPGGVHRARRTREYTLQVGGSTVTRPSRTLVHWLRGLADGSGDAVAMKALNLA